MAQVFVSYHHANDQDYKNEFVRWAVANGLMQDMSVDTGDIDDSLPNQTIRRMIRDSYLRESDVTIVLCGTETRFRKHVDWEIKSSMIDGSVNRRSGILVILLPTIPEAYYFNNELERKIVDPAMQMNLMPLSGKAEFEALYPNVPRRILENLALGCASIPIVPWSSVYGHAEVFSGLLRVTKSYGKSNQYDLSRPMRKKNFNPRTGLPDFRV